MSSKNNMPNINNLLRSPPRKMPAADLKKLVRNSGSTRNSPLTTNELEKLLRNSGSTRSSPRTTNELEKLLRNSGSARSSPSSPTLPNLVVPLLTEEEMQHFFNSPRARKNSPSPKKAPSPRKVSSPDRKFSHLHDGTNSGEKDPMGRVIWHGPRGGKFVISTIGKRVPYVNQSLKNKVNKQKMEFTGMVDRKGRKIYKGKSGGRFVITDTGRRANPLT